MENKSISSLCEFKWLNKKKEKCDVNLISQNSPTGYILEVDLEYPDELHELHNDYSLAPGKRKISHNMLSNIIAVLQINMT